MKHGSKISVDQEKGEFQLGYIYRTIEEQINTFAAQPGCPFTVDVIAIRVGDALRAKAEEIRQKLRASELVSQMRKDGKAIGFRGNISTSEAVYVDSRVGGALKPKRILSAKALKAISDAQKKRWRKQRREQRLKEKKARRSPSSGVKAYWAKFSPAERKAIMQARRAKIKKIA